MRSSDWSSDVCSSDLPGTLAPGQAQWDGRLRGAFDLGDMATRLADVAANIVLPTLYVRGAMSELVSPDDAADFVERLPDGEFAEVEDMALVVTDDRNAALGASLIDFLQRHAPRALPEYPPGST